MQPQDPGLHAVTIITSHNFNMRSRVSLGEIVDRHKGTVWAREQVLGRRPVRHVEQGNKLGLLSVHLDSTKESVAHPANKKVDVWLRRRPWCRRRAVDGL